MTARAAASRTGGRYPRVTVAAMRESDDGGMMQIGEVAERVGLSLRTVRYYEEMGLISPEKRSNGGFRLYTDENIDRLLLIKQMKPLGFSLQEMRELLDARDAVRSLDPGDPKRLQAADRLERAVNSLTLRRRACASSEFRSVVEIVMYSHSPRTFLQLPQELIRENEKEIPLAMFLPR